MRKMTMLIFQLRIIFRPFLKRSVLPDQRRNESGSCRFNLRDKIRIYAQYLGRRFIIIILVLFVVFSRALETPKKNGRKPVGKD